MALNDDEIKYKNIIKTLKSLPEINAPRNFEADLMRRINSETFKEKKSFWGNLFLPSKLIPSAALAVSAVVLFFLINTNNEAEDPLLMQPKIREDVVSPDNMLVIYYPLNYNNRKYRNGSYSGISGSENDKASQQNNDDLYFPDYNYLINKNGLNFRRINLTHEEQQRLNELKDHFKRLQNSGNR